MTKTYTFDIETDDYYARCQVEVIFRRLDDSFSHEFGVRHISSYEPDRCLILSVDHLNGHGEVDRSDRSLTQLICENAFRLASRDHGQG